MPTGCALTLDNVTAIPKALLTDRITRLGPAKLAELCKALNIATGC
jgi:mRNA-degrading endonuclease toxin of MazEF toxin-antitoxin module